MEYEKFLEIVKDAAQNHKRVTLHFSHPTDVFINNHWIKKLNHITLRFFEFGENEFIGYGYKKRSDSTHGYNIKSLDYFLINKVEYPDENIDDELDRVRFKKWVLRNLDKDVWPNMEKSIDSIIAGMSHNDLKRTYLKTICNEFELKAIEEMFNARKTGTFHIGYNRRMFVEMSQREDGYYAWLVIDERSSMLINPRVAILSCR